MKKKKKCKTIKSERTAIGTGCSTINSQCIHNTVRFSRVVKFFKFVVVHPDVPRAQRDVRFRARLTDRQELEVFDRTREISLAKMKSEIHSTGVRIVRAKSGVPLIRHNGTFTARSRAHIYTDGFARGILEVARCRHHRRRLASFLPLTLQSL